MDALCVVLQVRNRLKSLVATRVGAFEGPDVLRVRQHVILEMLFLLKRFDTANVGTLKLALMTLHVPVQLALRDKLAVQADRALKLEFLFARGL